MKYAVTGPRGIMAADMKLIESVIDGLSNVEEFITGGAFGIDTHAAIYAKKKFPKASHTLCLPRRSTFNHAMLDLEGFNHEWVDPTNNRSSLLMRNDRMVELSDVLLAFPKTTREEFRGSGTWACIRSAKKAGIELRMFPLSDVKHNI